MTLWQRSGGAASGVLLLVVVLIIVGAYLVATRGTSSLLSGSGHLQQFVPRPAHVEAIRLTGEWHGKAFVEAGHKGGYRALAIKGAIKNKTTDVLTDLRCPTRLRVFFENGRQIELGAGDICALAGAKIALAIIGLPLEPELTLRPGETHEFNYDWGRIPIGAALAGLALGSEYELYGIRRTVVEIDYVGLTPFGDRVEGRLVDAQIPPPTERETFPIGYRK